MMKKVLQLLVYLPVLFFIPFYPYFWDLFSIPSILTIGLASGVHLSQPDMELFGAGKTKEDNNSAMVLMWTFVLCMLAPMLLRYYAGVFVWNPTLIGVGLGISVFGLAFRIYAIRYLGKQFTTKVKIVDDHELINTGPYKYMRHPSYTGTMLLILGNALMYGSIWIAILITLAMYLGYQYRIKHEEKALIAHFGEKYIQYKQTTRAFL